MNGHIVVFAGSHLCNIGLCFTVVRESPLVDGKLTNLIYIYVCDGLKAYTMSSLYPALPSCRGKGVLRHPLQCRSTKFHLRQLMERNPDSLHHPRLVTRRQNVLDHIQKYMIFPLPLLRPEVATKKRPEQGLADLTANPTLTGVADRWLHHRTPQASDPPSPQMRHITWRASDNGGGLVKTLASLQVKFGSRAHYKLHDIYRELEPSARC